MCNLCVIKHLVQARVLLLESIKGYPLHLIYALGHLAEACDECEDDTIRLNIHDIQHNIESAIVNKTSSNVLFIKHTLESIDHILNDVLKLLYENTDE